MKKTDQNLRDISATHQLNIDVSHVQREDPTPVINRVYTELGLDISSSFCSPQAQLPSIRPTRSRRDDYSDLANGTETDLSSSGDVGVQATSTPRENGLSKAHELQSRIIFVAFMGGILIVAFLGIIVGCICSCCYNRRITKERGATRRPVKRQRRHAGYRERRAAREWENAGREWSVEERRRRYREGLRSSNRQRAIADEIEMAYINQVWLPRIG